MTESGEENYPEEDYVPFVGDDDDTTEEPEPGEWAEGESPYDRLVDAVQDEDAPEENGDES